MKRLKNQVCVVPASISIIAWELGKPVIAGTTQTIREEYTERRMVSLKVVSFTVPGEPKGKGRPRFSTKTGRAFTPTATVNYETLVHMEYVRQCDGFKFDDGTMLDMRIKAFYSIPSSGSKKLKEQKRNNTIRPTKKPDMDNVVKMVADALNNVAYKDDTQIVDCQVRKFFSDEPRIEVTIREIIPK